MSAPLRPAYARYVLGLLFVVYVMNFVWPVVFGRPFTTTHRDVRAGPSAN